MPTARSGGGEDAFQHVVGVADDRQSEAQALVAREPLPGGQARDVVEPQAVLQEQCRRRGSGPRPPWRSRPGRRRAPPGGSPRPRADEHRVGRLEPDADVAHRARTGRRAPGPSRRAGGRRRRPGRARTNVATRRPPGRSRSQHARTTSRPPPPTNTRSGSGRLVRAAGARPTTTSTFDRHAQGGGVGGDPGGVLVVLLDREHPQPGRHGRRLDAHRAAARADVPQHAGARQRQLAEHDRAHLGLGDHAVAMGELVLGAAPGDRRCRRRSGRER